MDIDESSIKKISGIETNAKLLNDVQGYLEFVEFLKWDWDIDHLWFRGVSHAKYRLIPSIYRSSVWKYDDEAATGAFEQFVRKAKPYVRGHQALTKWQWYFLMQHYGMPTRLLDWTEGSLIALYFAVRNPQNVFIPSVYVINPFWFDEIAHRRQKDEGFIFGVDECFLTNKENDILSPYLCDRSGLPNYPLFIEPPETDSRIVAQRSVFSIHGKKKNAFYEISANEEYPELFQLRISTKQSEYIKAELNSMGINEFTLFPDLEGLSKFIKWDWSMT